MATKYRDTSLLPDEDPNLRREILDVVGEEWLHAKSILLAGHSPEELIGTPDEFKVRIALRLIKGVEFS
jgi:hypothetical protein